MRALRSNETLILIKVRLLERGFVLLNRREACNNSARISGPNLIQSSLPRYNTVAKGNKKIWSTIAQRITNLIMILGSCFC